LAALSAALFASAPLAAQGTADWDVRPDSWYWGVYGGQTSFATTIARTNAPMIGVEWTITRTRFALNVFAEQSYFNAVSTVPDSGASSAPRRVDIQDMRRIGGSAMMFLPQYKYFHPWFGAGYGFNFIRQATPQGGFASPPAKTALLAAVENRRSQGKLFGELGMMVAYREWAPFLQYTVMPTQGTGSWMVNGDGFTTIWKLGFRYSFGTSIAERF
jgi:hypothetical protein